MSTFEATNLPNLVLFASYCAFFGCLVFLIDLIACKLKNSDSLIGIVYKGNNSLVLLGLWTIGAGLMAFVGGYVEIFQLNKQTVIALGVAWPVILSRLVSKGSVLDTSSDDQETE